MFIMIDYDEAKDKGIIKSEFLNNIREHFSIADDKANIKKHMFKFKNRFIPKRIYAITEAGRFELGLMVEILKYLQNLKTPFKIVFSETFKQRYYCSYSFAKEPLTSLKLPYRDYQTESIQKALANGNGIILSPTGSGKTLIMAGLIATIRHNVPKIKVLVITPTHLINQTYDEFLSYGIDPIVLSKWSGENELDTTSEIIISGSNIVTSKIGNTGLELKKTKVVSLTLKKALKEDTNLSQDKKIKIQEDILKIEKDMVRITNKIEANKKIHDFLATMGVLIMDEVHTLKKSNEITEITEFITTRHKFGFTGTINDNKIDEWNIVGKIGPIVYEVPRDMLVEQKHITDTNIQIIKIFYNDEPDYLDMGGNDDDDNEDNPTSRYESELQFIQTSIYRNNIIKKITEKLNKNTLIVVDRLDHGEFLLKFLTTSLNNKKVYFIKGEVEQKDREVIQKLMETENNIICIAISKIFSTGINIKNLHYIIFASAGKAKVKIIQTIGRGVRTLVDKIEVVIFDIADMLHYGKRHLQKRIELYENEGLKYKSIEIKEP